MDFDNRYRNTLSFLFSQFPQYQNVGAGAYKEGLEGMLALDRLLDHPHKKFVSIHVAGTNGKGSVSHMLAAVLQRAGFRTGLYTSPHLIDFRERIRINGEMISKEEVLLFMEQYKADLEELRPSFFEITTAMAFRYFAQQGVEIAVIEAGLGGRLDSTNIIDPALSVITNIGLDHCEYLGSTLASIAAEKAGIIKPMVPVVIGERQTETDGVFENCALALQAPLYFAEDAYMVEECVQQQDRQCFFIKEKRAEISLRYSLDLLGAYQQRNIVTVLTALTVLNRSGKVPGGRVIDEGAIQDAFCVAARMTGLRGRWEVLSEDPRVVVDTGHNAHGLHWVLEQLKKEHFRKLHIVFGVVAEKDLGAVLPLLPAEASYYFSRAQIPRALDAHVLARQCREAGLEGEVVEGVAEALAAAKAKAGPEDLIFVGGSTFVVAEVLGEGRK